MSFARPSARVLAVIPLALALVLGGAGTREAAAISGPEAALRDLVNNARAANGAPRIWVSTPLSNYARAHSRNMAAANVLSHQDLVKLLKGWNWRALGENVGYAPNVQQIHAAWMASSPHRANILNRSFDRMGVGVHIDASGRRWATVIFFGD